MTTTDNTAANQGELTALRLPDLRKIAADLGLKGVSALRKGDLIAAINTARTGGTPSTAKKTSSRKPANAAVEHTTDAPAQAPSAPAADTGADADKPATAAPARRGRRRVTTPATTPEAAPEVKSEASQADKPQSTQEQLPVAEAQESSQNTPQGGDQDERFESRSAARRARRNRQRQIHRDGEEHSDNAQGAEGDKSEKVAEQETAQASTSNDTTDSAQHSTENSRDDSNDNSDNNRNNNRRERGNRRGNRNNNRDNRDNNHDSADSSDNEQQNNQSGANNAEQSDDNNNDDRRSRNNGNNRNDRNDRDNRHDDNDDRRGRRGRRNRRGRNDRNDRDNRHDRDNSDGDNTPVQEDQLQPVAGILDIVDNNVAFVRTTGYHAASSDVFVSNQLIRRMGLRSGDAIVGQVRMNQGGNHSNHGRNRQKYNNLVRVETVNGLSVEETRNRPDFGKLTPLYPNQRLRLETEPKILTTRVIDLIMPIGKGQRALIVSPPKAGKTTILQNIANAISTNNPECYLMVVLVDERPEEVTDMQRSVHGEVIASTFDRPPSEHTAVAELAIERAKRLVEQGQDVVVLLDSITRLGRAYNNSSPASGRILSGGVDSNALYPPKRFLGAARNIENGGSLTIIATAMVETGSAGDTVIFEEFKGTGNAELKLDRKISERRVFPAVDVNPSGTRKDELLLNPDEARIMHKLRRILSALDNQQAIDLLIKQLKKTKSNAEFLMQVASSAPMAGTDKEEDYS